MAIPTFQSAVFTSEAHFARVRFTGDLVFDGATFEGGADFSGAHFSGGASFVNVSFGPRHSEEPSVYAPRRVADFTNVVFAFPDRVSFRRVNHDTLQGLRLRAIGCNIESVSFEDVTWHREGTRLVLQDELDLLAWSHRPRNATIRAYVDHIALQASYGSSEPHPADVHGLVSATYTRLLRNFDDHLSYDCAEDAFCGVMEMKRLDPQLLPLRKFLRWLYTKFPPVSAIARCFSLVSLYKLVSYYGSSYRQAIAVLVSLLITFGVVYAFLGGGIINTTSARKGAQNYALSAGMLASLEVASFQRERITVISTLPGNIARIGETILVPAQLAIVLLAVRRRFKR